MAGGKWWEWLKVKLAGGKWWAMGGKWWEGLKVKLAGAGIGWNWLELKVLNTV